MTEQLTLGTWRGLPGWILDKVLAVHPDVLDALMNAQAGASDQQISDYQAAVLYALAKPFDGEPVVELGTKYGYSTAMLAQACRRSPVFSLDISQDAQQRAWLHLKHYGNVILQEACSWKAAADFDDGELGLVFVDADHSAGVQLDAAAWWPKLRPAGLMVFHDYSARFPKVIEAVGSLCEHPDVLIVNVEDGEGMAGVYKR